MAPVPLVVVVALLVVRCFYCFAVVLSVAF
jgi:hypothetical protein